MKPISPIFQYDSYKIFHRIQYPKGTTLVYSNFTPRSSRIPNQDYVVFFGLQYFVKEYLINQFNELFFNKPKDEVLADYEHRIKIYCNLKEVDTQHIADLHDLGYLPLVIKAVPEGTKVPLRMPVLTIYNTNPKFYWLTNYIETMLSNIIWHPITSATIADKYRRTAEDYADQTGANKDFIQWQLHDFSYRGLAGIEAACLSGAAHLLSFTGSDTFPATEFLTQYYNADLDNELISGSVMALEHSCQQTGILSIAKDHSDEEIYKSEVEYWKYLLTEACPEGIVSIVADTFDYYRNLTETLPLLKDIILNRNGKVVVRPDSSPKTPIEVICGDLDAPIDSPEHKGSIQLLWDVFGGTINEAGYKVLNPKIGLIYGDSITHFLKEVQVILVLWINHDPADGFFKHHLACSNRTSMILQEHYH
jgi:nicotinamide phosphoribosyltransferase